MESFQSSLLFTSQKDPVFLQWAENHSAPLKEHIFIFHPPGTRPHVLGGHLESCRPAKYQSYRKWKGYRPPQGRGPNPPGQEEQILLSVTGSASILAATLQWQQLGEVQGRRDGFTEHGLNRQEEGRGRNAPLSRRRRKTFHGIVCMAYDLVGLKGVLSLGMLLS